MQNSTDPVLNITNLVVTSRGFYLTCSKWYLNDPELTFSIIYIAESIRDHNLIVSGSYQTLPWRSGSINWQIEFSYSCFYTERRQNLACREQNLFYAHWRRGEASSKSGTGSLVESLAVSRLLGQNCNFSSINFFLISFADTVSQPACWDFAFFSPTHLRLFLSLLHKQCLILLANNCLLLQKDFFFNHSFSDDTYRVSSELWKSECTEIDGTVYSSHLHNHFLPYPWHRLPDPAHFLSNKKEPFELLQFMWSHRGKKHYFLRSSKSKSKCSSPWEQELDWNTCLNHRKFSTLTNQWNILENICQLPWKLVQHLVFFSIVSRVPATIMSCGVKEQ